MNETIVVFGISGVGKTTACRSFAARHPEFLHLSASSLLREATNLSEEILREASADVILRNQVILSEALRRKRQQRPDAKIIIDGQSIIDNGRDLIRIPVEIVRSLQPSGLILLEAAPDEVARRRRDSGTRRPTRTPSELASQMEYIQQAVVNYANRLRIPLQIGVVTQSFELDSLVNAISRP